MAAKKYLDRQVANCKGFTYVQENSEDGQLRNLFWIDGRSREAFKYFGDVVSFDTTFLKNKYKFPFAPFCWNKSPWPKHPPRLRLDLWGGNFELCLAF